MGRVKQEWEEYQDRRWVASDKFVCADCVEDDFLKEVITRNLANRKCGYCGRGGKGYVAAPVAAIMEPIAATFFDYFADPVHAGVPYDGGLVFEGTHTTEDVLRHIGLECHETLFADVAGGIDCDTLWIEAAGGFWASEQPSDHMIYGWERFAKTVKHESRFFFSTVPCRKISSEYSPAEMLAEIGRAVSDLGLLRALPSGTTLYRARERESDASWALDATQMGPPPNEKAQSQRMNPAGISYFYLAMERETALAEVMRKQPSAVAIGSFTPRRDLWLLDLTDFSKLPSIFDRARRDKYELLLFLSEFTRQISEPVQKDGREHLDYVPSQVVSEYFAKIYRKADGDPLDGMAYPSAVRPDGINIVLFPPKQGWKGFMELMVELAAGEAKKIAFQNWTELCQAIR